MKPRSAAVAAIALIAATLAWHALRPSGAASVASRATAAYSAIQNVPPPSPLHAASPALATLASQPHRARDDSLRGAAVDGAVHVDANGRPLADRDLRRLFDYFLTRLGERATAAIRDDVLAHLRDVLHLDLAAQAQVLAWFDAYAAASRAVAQLPRSGDMVADTAQLHELHRQALGAHLAQAWFGADDDYALYTAQRLAIEHDADLDAAEKFQRLTALEATLDPAQLEDLHAATDFQLAVAQSRELDNAGADAGARFAERAALWGDAAAARLAELDQSEAQWNARVGDYAHERAMLLADSTLPPQIRAARLAALLSGFTASEQTRLLSLAQAGALPH